jgi:Ca-activated chloride channel homolog
MRRNFARCYNRRTMRSLGIALLSLVIAGMTFAQTAKPPQQQPAKAADEEQQTIRVNATLVNTLFTVADKKGKFITNLKQDDFKVFEDDKLQAIANFSSESNLPLSVALLVDTSGSIRDKLRFEQEAAIEFFYATVHRGKDRAMIISFDSGVDLVQDFTDNPETLADSVRKIRAGGGTSLYDAIYLAVSEKLAKESEQRRKVLILISDGDDNSSRLSMTETLDAAQRHNVTIYSISTNATLNIGGKDQERGDKTLKKFSDETGGKTFFPLKLQDLSVSFTDIGEELRSQYTIGYRPSRLDDGTFRRIRIDVANKNYRARSRSGYYAPKSASR